MKINPAIFRAYDIRGKVGEDLDSAVIEAIGKAYGTYIKGLGGRKVSLVRDDRDSSMLFAKDFSRGVLSTGIDLVDLGLATTPMLYFSIIKLDLDGGAVITGSHTAENYNGVKLCKERALHIFGDELQIIRQLIKSKTFSSGRGYLSKYDIFDDYLANILQSVTVKRTLRVVISCNSGSTKRFVSPIFERLGLEVIDGSYEEIPSGDRDSDPSDPQNLISLSQSVREGRADLGVAFDVDGDRLGVVDERGHFLPAEVVASLFAQDILQHSFWHRIRQRKKEAPKFICDVKSLLGFIELVTGWGGEVEMLPTGRSFFRQKLFEDSRVVLGVEAAGHFYFNNRYFGFDDGFFAAARLLELISKRKKKLSELAAVFPRSFYTPTIEPYCPDDRKFIVVNKLASEFRQRYATINIDGVRIKFDTKSWALIRASNTGPRLSLRFEAPSKKRLEEIAALVRRSLNCYPEVGHWNLRFYNR